MQRTDLQDTTVAARRRVIARLRELTPEEKLRMTFERIEAARAFRKRTESLRPGTEKR